MKNTESDHSTVFNEIRSRLKFINGSKKILEITVNFMGLIYNELKRLSQDKKFLKNFGRKQFFTC